VFKKIIGLVLDSMVSIFLVNLTIKPEATVIFLENIEKLPQSEFFKKQKKVNKPNVTNSKSNKSEPSYSLRSRIQKSNSIY